MRSLIEPSPEPVVHDPYPYEGLPTRYEWHLKNLAQWGTEPDHVVLVFDNPGDAMSSITINHDHITWLGPPHHLTGYLTIPQPELNHDDPWGLQIDLNDPPATLALYLLERVPLTE